MRLKADLRFPRNPRRIRLHRKKVTQNFVFDFPPPVLKFLRKATKDVSGIFAFDRGETGD
jgi:hypothetical protein